MSRSFIAVLRRELRLAASAKIEWLMPLLFYALVVLLFGLGARPNDPQLAVFAPAVMWVGALLAALLTLERLFRSDYEDGTLEQIFLGAEPVTVVVLAKFAAHWLLTGLPLALLSAPLAAGLGLATDAIFFLTAGLLLGTPVLTLIGGFAGALTVGLPRAGVLLPLLVLPLVTPVLIFGAGAVRAAQSGLDATAPLYFLAAVLALAVSLLPWATAAALRNSFE
ncbi:MAG: heme exporter protein CcmB [Stenotrophobium sp.]